VVPGAQVTPFWPGRPPGPRSHRRSPSWPQGTATVCENVAYLTVTVNPATPVQPSWAVHGHMRTGKPSSSCWPGRRYTGRRTRDVGGGIVLRRPP
jgi:hypothetical protein